MKGAGKIRGLAFSVAGLLTAATAAAQFRDDFRGPTLPLDPSGANGWAFFTGDGAAVMDFRQADGYASIFVDATKDTRNVWWALIMRRVSRDLDLSRLAEPGRELRISARVRASHAPRRVNLHLNTQKTTDFHSHLMEFDLPEAGVWYPISMTTRDFEASPGDTVNSQLALMDWGLGQYRVDVDDFRVDVVDAQFPDVNFDGWSALNEAGGTRLLTVGGTRLVLLRWDFGELAGKRTAGSGLLELTTYALEALVPKLKDFGEVRVVEILGGDPAWNRDPVTWAGFLRGEAADDVLNSQMIIDWGIRPGRGEKTYFAISRPALQRLLNGRTLGLAVRPLGAIQASFLAREEAGEKCAARLLFNLEK